MKTVVDLINHCHKAIKDEVKYIYGAKYEKLNRQQILNLKGIYGSMIWDSDLSKAGNWCCDCSGLISSCTGISRNSTNYMESALKTISIADLKENWNNYIGWGLWMKGHIGIVSETYNYYYAMDGSARNMVKNPMSMQGWTKCIKLKDIDYTGGYIDMEELKKLQASINELNNTVFNILNSVRELNKDVERLQSKQEDVYNTVDEVPAWGKPTVKKLLEKGLLTGTNKGLNLNYTFLRLLVINDRAGIYG